MIKKQVRLRYSTNPPTQPANINTFNNTNKKTDDDQYIYTHTHTNYETQKTMA